MLKLISAIIETTIDFIIPFIWLFIGFGAIVWLINLLQNLPH